ncbi:sensor histidine kinase [Terrimonas pollutisoli]|uniref:sensor histidine kinase n=1 Tax=Terrimonas pollutisoli TaxID=3034147 RepID=UPI0023ED293C|nr:ATP-binding protein [Terrimonas sp. H1YJ31]
MDTIETSIYTAVLICCVVLGLVFLYFGITIVRRQRKHYEMQKANFLAEIELLDGERNRIASDLHDELGPLLSITKIEINEIKTGDTESLALQARANQHIEELTERLGGIARNLTPRRLLQKGLDAALEDYFKQYQEGTSIHLQFHYQAESTIPVLLRSQIYKMVQEMVHNAVKHSGGTFLKVMLQQRKNLLYIYCKDDGIGIRTNTASKSGLGLDSLKNRVALLGGRMQFSGNGGTEYFIEIPLTD